MKRFLGPLGALLLIAGGSVTAQLVYESEVVGSSYVPTFQNKTGTNANATYYATAYGAGVWAKVEGSTPVYSTNGGQDWVAGTTNVTAGRYSNIEFVNNRFFALCSTFCTAGRQIQYSDDGMTWTAANVPTTNVPVADAHWNDVAYGNGVLVAVSSGMLSGNETANRILRSTDNGATWQIQTLPQINSFPQTFVAANAVVFANGQFILVGNRTLTSSDGITWTNSNSTFLNDIAFGNGVLLAIMTTGNGSNHLYRSTNWGSSWSAVTHPSLGISPQYVHRIRFGNGVFLFGSSTRFVTTVNGTSFSSATNWLSLGSGQWRGLGFGAGQFLAVGDTSIGGASRTIASTDTPDTTAPSLVQQSPSDGATGIEYTTNITLTFSENVGPGPGQHVTIKKVSDNSTVTSIDASSSQVTFSGATVTVNPTVDLPTSTALYVLINQGAFTDIAGNGYAGISSSSGYQFTTAADVTPPAPPTTPDLSDASDAGLFNTDNITSVVNPQFRFRGAENGGTITVTASRSGLADKTCTRPGATYLDACSMSGLSQGTWTVVATHTDVNGNTSANSAALTIVVDTTAPALTAISPTRDAVGIAVNSNIQLTYNEDVYAAIGDFLVKSGGSTCPTTEQTISSTSAAVTVSGDTVTVNPPNNFAHSTVQCLSISAGVVKDIAGNNAPLHDPTAAGGVRFTTSSADVTSPSVTVTSPSSPAGSRTLVYAVVFDEVISGLTNADFSNLGTANCTFAAPTSSGTSFSITATCTSDGTVILRLAPNSVTDGASNTGPTSAVQASTVTIDTTTPSTAPSGTVAPTQSTVPSSGTTVPPVGTGPSGPTPVAQGVATTVAPTTTLPVPSTTTTTLPSVDVPEVADSGGALVVNGQRIEATITRENNQLVIAAGVLRARISAVQREGGRAPLDSEGRIRMDQGDSIEIEVTGFGSESQVEVRMYSDPVLLGRSTVSALGNLMASYEVPDSVIDGRHTVVLLGESQQREELTFALAVFVGADSAGPSALVLLVGIPLGLAVIAALVIPAILRRRRKDEEEK
ncbi:unannotated protein [freshwater metagenome]|uniref:Unannotated protein n=1 Tax=freshwater metagenome TaxID=449393 RepID=A0A6J6K105_9ZZZZ